jgi:precorrin-2/cobalt-factor-2 C20-methyltransferase
MINLFAIGVGPGDPDLLTIKAKKAMNASDIVFCPIKKEGASSFALEIVESHLDNDRVQVEALMYPMTYDQSELKRVWRKNGQRISEALRAGKICSFITLGDVPVYSTFMYTLPFIDKAHLELEIIPGITSFSAVASKVGQPLMLWEESLKIVPVRKNDVEQLSTAIASSENIVLMKPSNNPQAIIQLLEKYQLENKFMLISKVGTEEENIINEIEVLKSMKLPYLSTMIIKKGGFYE